MTRKEAEMMDVWELGEVIANELGANVAYSTYMMNLTDEARKVAYLKAFDTYIAD